MTPREAQQIADIIRHVSDREEILDALGTTFPQHHWHDLIKVVCPSCGRQQNYLYRDGRWCYGCVPAGERLPAVTLDQLNEATRRVFQHTDEPFRESPLLSLLRR